MENKTCTEDTQAWPPTENIQAELDDRREVLLAQLAGNKINHPKHYNSGKFEVIDVIEDWKLNFHLGNAVKYIARAGKKPGSDFKEDLEKAIWYLQRELDRMANG